jgi:uncharacterized membrane protein
LPWFNRHRHGEQARASGTAVASLDPNWVDAMSFRPFTSESYAQDDRSDAWRDVLGAVGPSALSMTDMRLRPIATGWAWR